MKRILCMTVGAFLLLAVSGAAAQSLGDVARSARKGKLQQVSAKRQYDNDNLPKGDHLSVVGPAPADDANTVGPSVDGNGQPVQAAPTVDPNAAAEDRKKAADEWKDKLSGQKEKIDSLSHELELTEREYRLRAVAMYSDAGNRLRSSATWDKEDADYKKQLEDKQKAVDAAKKELEDLNEQARKAGAAPKD